MNHTAKASKQRILIVDDEPDVRAMLRAALAPEGFCIAEAGSGAEMMDAIRIAAPDLITLDLKLSGEDGLRLARELRSCSNVPIIIITGKNETVERVVGLELGADDYITKPFHMREVLAWVRAILRRYPHEPAPAGQACGMTSERYEFDGWLLDLTRRELRMPSGAVCELTAAEFEFLTILVKRSRRVLSRDNIMDLLKGRDWSPLDRTIDGLVARLRRKIEPENERPRLIKTVRGVGYAFGSEVKRA
ncbi:MAG: response regulator transcription factor [Rhodomicrobium sp.]